MHRNKDEQINLVAHLFWRGRHANAENWVDDWKSRARCVIVVLLACHNGILCGAIKRCTPILCAILLHDSQRWLMRTAFKCNPRKTNNLLWMESISYFHSHKQKERRPHWSWNGQFPAADLYLHHNRISTYFLSLSANRPCSFNPYTLAWISAALRSNALNRDPFHSRARHTN